LAGDFRAEVQILGSADFVLIADFLVVVLEHVEADEGI